MISKADIKFIKSLYIKKYRQQEGLFIAEGIKTVSELLPYFNSRNLYATEDCTLPAGVDAELVSYADLRKISNMECPQNVLAVFEMKKAEFKTDLLKGRFSLALDGVQDAGNLGTIIRLADWFGVENILCSHGTVDVYNPKTVQATAGALARVAVHYCDLSEILTQAAAFLPVYGTALDGVNLYADKFKGEGILVFGNEGNGISKQVRSACNKMLLIPTYPADKKSTESLNVGTAVAVALSEIRRQNVVDGI